MGINLTLITKDPLQNSEALVFDITGDSQHIILAINPGSTSTKIAVFSGKDVVLEQTLRHSIEEIASFGSVIEQYKWRKQLILDTLAQHKIDVNTLSAVIGRGGLLHPIESGVYEVNQIMIDELTHTKSQHASNLGAIIANEIAAECQVKAYIADPVVVDELEEVNRLTGVKSIRRRSIFHALNQKAMARRYADDIGRPYEELNLVVAHLGGGISVAAHCQGRVIDCNNALDGDGPIAPERAGTIPAGDLIDLCYSGKYTHKEARSLIVGGGGLVSLCNSNSVIDIQQRATQGDTEAALALDAMCYGVAKHIGQMAVALNGEVDAIILTGGIAHSPYVTNTISKKCRFIAPIEIYAGENELQALAMNALLVLQGSLEAKTYE
ncbi:MAG: butyrate kinase [Alistipes sp.]|jgi:butyrate kinase|nr:butyrate kinase [Alistipes sp.]MBO7194688.1 butyrate kinase [Alistipes sp.]